MGELGLCYRLAGIAFVGKSLVRAGRAEPAGGGAPRLRGGGRAARGEFPRHRRRPARPAALAEVADAAALAAWVDALLRDPARRRRRWGTPASPPRPVPRRCRPSAPPCCSLCRRPMRPPEFWHARAAGGPPAGPGGLHLCRGDGAARGAAGLAGAGAGDLLRQRNRRRRRQDHPRARPGARLRGARRRTSSPAAMAAGCAASMRRPGPRRRRRRRRRGAAAGGVAPTFVAADRAAGAHAAIAAGARCW